MMVFLNGAVGGSEEKVGVCECEWGNLNGGVGSCGERLGVWGCEWWSGGVMGCVFE